MKTLKQVLFSLTAVLLFLGGASSTAFAAHTRADLLSEYATVQPGVPFRVAIRLRMEPKWHTYWQNPGESGSPTTITWKLPAGVTAGPIQWPFPHRITLDPVTTYAYEGQVLLFTEITPSKTLSTDRPLRLAAHVDWLECEVECVPAAADVELSIPVKNAAPMPDTALSALFAEYNARLPLASSDWNVTVARRATGYRITIAPPAGVKADSLGPIEFFPEEREIIDDAPVLREKASGDNLILDLEPSEYATEPAKRLVGVLVSEKGWRGPGSERALRIDVPIEGMATDAPSRSLPVILFFAFLGGMILNLMPCVLPILSIKILGFIQGSGGDPRAGRTQGLVFGAGVLASFWILAGALIALRAAGEQLGWGFQLQTPGFVLFLASLFFLLALSMVGVFEIGTSLIGVGGNVARKGGVSGAFFSGVLATLIATPCTAPFMGSALGYALSQPAVVSLAVFTALALGMALPYVFLSTFPQFLKFVPKPGPWMDTFKQAMGFLLFGTVVWLTWVLARQAGADGTAIALGVLFFQSIGGWIYGRWATPLQPSGTRRIATAVALLLVIVPFVGATKVLRVLSSESAATSGETHGIWEPYSAARVQELRAQGKPVFVNFTAAWCLTCQVNKRVALHTQAVEDAFQKHGVATLVADWTSRDPVITEALRGFGRSGVPTYVLFPADPKAEPRLLPELLTQAIVIEALDDLKK